MQDESYYKTWETRYDEAELDIHAKEVKTEALIDEIEQQLTLIGTTGAWGGDGAERPRGELTLALYGLVAVEDKLQVGVPETISLFQKAGIKVRRSNAASCGRISGPHWPSLCCC